MRTVKFRGFDPVARKWVYGDQVHDLKVTVTGLAPRTKVCGYEVAEESVGQFTGLEDRNGKEIYDGDIIYSEFSDGSHCNGLVGWNEDEVCFGLMDEYAYRSLQEGFDFPQYKNHVLLSFRKDAIRFEVIGNLFSDAGLLASRQPAKSKEQRIKEAMEEVEAKSKAFTEQHRGEDADTLLRQMRGQEPFSEELDEAAASYERTVNYDGDIHSNTAIRASFKAGAQWDREQLTKDAVERKVMIDAGGYPYISCNIELYDYDKDEALAKEGDKVKLVIIQ